LGIFLSTTASRTALGSTQPPIQWVPGALSLGIMRPGREADHSAPSNAEVKEWIELYLHSPNTPSRRGAQLKHRDNLTTASKTALGPTQPPIQWVPGAPSLGVKWPGREADHSPPTSAEVKEWVKLYLHSPNTPPWRFAQKKSTGTTLPYLIM
jgi:hypothetical protein